jgi:hypothetical protein
MEMRKKRRKNMEKVKAVVPRKQIPSLQSLQLRCSSNRMFEAFDVAVDS